MDCIEKNSAQFLSMIMDTSPNLVVTTYGKAMYSANKATLAFLGYEDVATFLKEHECICDFFEPITPNALLKQMGELSWVEHLIEFPHQNIAYMKKEGQLHTFEVHAGKFTIDEEIIYTAIFNNVSLIEKQKELYEEAIEGTELGLWDWDIEKDSLYLSAHWKKMIGYEDEELPNVYASWQNRLHPEDRDFTLKAMQDAIEGHTEHYHCIYRLRHKQGYWIWIDSKAKVFLNPSHQARRMIGVHSDISLIKEREAQNLRDAKRFEALAQLPLLSETLEELPFIQKALEVIEDITQSKVSFMHFISDDESTIELVAWSKRTLEEQCNVPHDTHYPTLCAGVWIKALHQKQALIINDYPSIASKQGLPKGHIPLTRFISLPIMEEGKVVMMCGLGNKKSDYGQEDTQTLELLGSEVWRIIQRRRNQSELKKVNDLLLAQSRHAAMGEMVSMIAHQWRQPISIISMCANNLLLDMELDSIEPKELDKQLNDILKQTEHLSSTINDFRNFFKPNKIKEYLNVQTILESALTLMEKSFTNSDISISLQSKSQTPILLHERELLQVFLNILKNAKEALDSSKTPNGFIRINLYETPTDIITQIYDNAGGIPEAYLKKIFEPYFSTKEEKDGTGLGLYMSKTIVEKHLLGKLEAFNHEGGALFSITLPKPNDETHTKS